MNKEELFVFQKIGHTLGELIEVGHKILLKGPETAEEQSIIDILDEFSDWHKEYISIIPKE